MKEFGYNMPVVSPGDVVLEVNRVVVSPNSIDRVSIFNQKFGYVLR